MKIKLLILLLLTTIAKAQVGIGTPSPDASSSLDVFSSNTGVLIPRIALTLTTSASPVTAPLESLLVYNTATVADVTPGFYYWSGTAWIRLFDKVGWDLNGNSGVTASNFIGSINAADLILKTTNSEKMRITSAGNVGVGDASPASLFTVGNGDLFQIQSTGHAQGIFGTAASPTFSFVGNTNSGMFRNALNEISFSTAGIEAARFTPTQRFNLTTYGTAASPAISWTTDSNTGFYHSTITDDFGLSTNGFQRMWFSDAGEVYVGATAPILPGDLFCATASNTNAVTSASGNLVWAINGYTAYQGAGVYGLRLAGSPGTWGGVQGELSAGLAAGSRGVYGYAASTNQYGVQGYKPAGGSGFGGLFLNDLGYSGGFFLLSDRSLKRNINPLNNALKTIDKLSFYTYKYKTDEYDVLGDKDQIHYGVMANELKTVLPDLVKTKYIGGDISRADKNEAKNLNKEIDMVNYIELVPIALQAIKEQQELIKQQQIAIEKLQKEVEELKKK
ncbi:tail fiber domain-containing protein [Flavobacterium sp. SUN052]|uniref:tail fiber domain-containing protein n=1 Tax=Flavobacterium sp. SUN052 TaxID=3002441 RepID=UPI00237D7626|nr:tail fiber domain-containing protein [Flavobacterium sp. SUN052]MEC4005325.1 tail fiber domain-containing protein [Flavobacterium sp. SUN052]